ncbi:MAG: ribonuclease H-like domain-containing protein [Acidobacteriota bacterium]|nr:ribonuclease H-like domain-containing protein [Acidobacteriota bacterium]
MKIAYLDIETDYVGPFNDKRLFRDHKNHNITILGLRILDAEPDGESGVERESGEQFFQFVGDDLSRENLLLTLGGVRRIVTYNGRSLPDDVKRSVGFDFPVIATHFGIVLDREFEHTDLVPECWRRGLYGGLKEVEKKLGLVRDLPGKDGLWAVQTWRKYCDTGDRKLLDEVLLYNREDVFMLRAVELKLQSIPPTVR